MLNNATTRYSNTVQCALGDSDMAEFNISRKVNAGNYYNILQTFKKKGIKLTDYELPKEELQKYLKDLEELPKAEMRKSGKW